jgi:Triose-phosphate Transporter family
MSSNSSSSKTTSTTTTKSRTTTLSAVAGAGVGSGGRVGTQQHTTTIEQRSSKGEMRPLMGSSSLDERGELQNSADHDDHDHDDDKKDVDADDDENMNDRNKGHGDSSYKMVLPQVLIILRRYILLMGNIFLWYITNGMHGIAMQSLSKKLVVVKKNDDNEAAAFIDKSCMIVTTLLVTAVQLLAGALLGCCLLWLHSTFILQNSSSSNAFHLQHHLQGFVQNPFDSILHGLGSIFTNFGFMYGSAAVVQIIKLLEPFETLLLTKALIPKEGKLLTLGIASSMMLTTGAAMGLIRSRKTSAPLPAMVFAILSGLSLSTRNVLQRRQQQRLQQDDGGTSDGSKNSNSDNSNSSVALVSKGSDLGAPPSSTTAAAATTKATAKPKKSALEGSLVQFTQLSIQSGIFIQLVTLVLYAALWAWNTSFYQASFTMALNHLNVRVFVWHPLYNAFSMITLGFCTAVTHSLWNAGKRVFAIVMAIVWFRESFTRPTAMGLFLVFLGGCWYTMETNGIVLGGSAAGGRNTSTRCTPTNGIKLLLALALVVMSHWMHTMQNIHDMISSAKLV